MTEKQITDLIEVLRVMVEVLQGIDTSLSNMSDFLIAPRR